MLRSVSQLAAGRKAASAFPWLLRRSCPERCSECRNAQPCQVWQFWSLAPAGSAWYVHDNGIARFRSDGEMLPTCQVQRTLADLEEQQASIAATYPPGLPLLDDAAVTVAGRLMPDTSELKWTATKHAQALRRYACGPGRPFLDLAQLRGRSRRTAAA